MAAKQRPEGLEIDQDLAFQQKMWRFQRFGWLALLLVALAAAVGVFGVNGPLSRQRASAEALQLEYQRFVRYETPAALTVQLAPQGGDSASLWLGQGFAERFLVEQIVPEPERVEATPERVTYTFATPRSGGPLQVTLHIRPQQPGPSVSLAGAGDGRPIEFYQFIYP
jgi:hypothetical protein